MMPAPATSRALVNLGAYARNLAIVREHIPRKCGLMPVVKANAYGLGAVPVARRAVDEGAGMLAVGTVAEGAELRDAGIETPLLVTVQPSREALPAVIEYGLRVMVSDVALAERLGELARRANHVVPVHVKVDTGMGRQGLSADEAVDSLRQLTRISHIDIEGIATHFSVAEVADDPFTLNQIRTFRRLLKQAVKAGIPYEFAHAANSAALVNYAPSLLDMVRPGLLTYGVWPAEGAPTFAVQPVLRWETTVVLIKDLVAGASVGYGRTYITRERTRAALLPVGYADGYKYQLGNAADVLIRGRRCPIRGSVCMDQMVVDVTHVPEVRVGDTAVLIGADGDETVTVTELAQRAGTVPHDILAGLGRRVTREYLD